MLRGSCQDPTEVDLAYLTKNPVNFVPLILMNGAESRKKKNTIVISVSSRLHLAHKKNRRFFHM